MKEGFDSAGQLRHGGCGMKDTIGKLQAPPAIFQPSQPEYCQIETLPVYILQEQTRLSGAERAACYVAIADQFDNVADYILWCVPVCNVHS
jgi:hypothetical protein